MFIGLRKIYPRSRSALASALVATVAGGGCGPLAGEEGQRCTATGFCVAPFVCANNLCVQPVEGTIPGGPNLTFARAEVVSDNNSDGQVNRGERIGLGIVLRNNGSNRAGSVRATLSSSTPGVTLTGQNGSYGDIPAGQERTSQLFSFQLADTVNPGQQLAFSLLATDGDGAEWPLTFRLEVQATGAGIGFARAEVVSDNNNDGQVNRGERVGLGIVLRNNGSSRANSVRANLSSSSPGVSVTGQNGFYGDIPAGQERTDQLFSFQLADTANPGQQLAFSLLATDGDGNEWPLTFQLQVEATAASISFARAEVLSDSNNDGRVNRGERVGLGIVLRNNGSSRANSVRANLSSSSPGVSVTGQNGFYGDIPAGQERTDQLFSFQLADTANPGQQLEFSLLATDGDGNEWPLTFQLQVEATAASISFARAEVLSDSNNDGRVNRGERVGLGIVLRNNGSSRANSVRANLSSSSPGVSVTGQNGFYGDIPAGQERTDQLFSFQLADSVMAGTTLNYQIDISDAEGNAWVSQFTLMVQ